MTTEPTDDELRDIAWSPDGPVTGRRAVYNAGVEAGRRDQIQADAGIASQRALDLHYVNVQAAIARGIAAAILAQLPATGTENN